MGLDDLARSLEAALNGEAGIEHLFIIGAFAAVGVILWRTRADWWSR